MLSWQSRLDPRDIILCLKEWMNWVLRHEIESWVSSFTFQVSRNQDVSNFHPLKGISEKTLLFSRGKEKWPFFFLRLVCVTLTEKTAYTCIHQAKKDTITILSLCISKNQHPSPSSMQMLVSHEPSLVVLALMSLLWLSGRASGLLTRRL